MSGKKKIDWWLSRDMVLCDFFVGLVLFLLRNRFEYVTKKEQFDRARTIEDSRYREKVIIKRT